MCSWPAGWTGQPFGALAWLIVMYLVAIVLAALMALTRHDVAYLLVLVWAFIGIAVNYSSMTGVLIASILATSAVAALVLLMAARCAVAGQGIRN